MSAGTLTLTNNSAAVTGSGTAFNNELAAGDFIVVKAGGVTYTLPVKTIEGDTALTLARNYNGPDITAGAWTAMPRDTLNRISAQIAADTAYAIRQRVLEIDNWYQLLEVNGDVTIKMADGSSYTGPSWLKLIDVMKEMQIDVLIPIAEQIRADAQQVADDKPIIIQAKDDAQAAASAAAASEHNAAESETNSAASEEVATQKAKEAKESAEQAAASNPLLALQKANNLSDLADRAAAWLNVRPIGATPLAADAVNDYDAPTWRQVRNLIESGTTGPTMNGVMNYHVGEAVSWETRAYYPPNCLPRDGQIVNRADWPELWAWAQKTTPLDDAVWLADVTKRGSYSNGNGTTTFRVPDWNGVQPGSIPGVFFRGGSGAADMIMALNAVPEIAFTYNPVFPGVTQIPADSYTGAAEPLSIEPAFTNPGGGVVSSSFQRGLRVKASKANAAYGRNNTGEVVPNKVSGVWLVRASGGFVAANTSWSVWNSDTAAPANGTTVKGGKVRSVYRVGTSEFAAAELQTSVVTSSAGVRTVSAEVVVTDSTSGTAVSKTIKLGTVDGLTGGLISGNIEASGFAKVNLYHVGAQLRATMLGEGRNVGLWNEYQEGGIGNAILEYIDPAIGRRWLFQATGNAVSPGAWTPNSDSRLKTNTKLIENPLDRMRKMGGYTWTRLDSGQWGIGFIAQEVQDVFPEAVSVSGDRELEDGTVVKDVLSPDTYGVAAALHHESILQLMDIVKDAITTIAGVTTDEGAKTALEELAERIPVSDIP
ncbi:tail fiber domain-containing protein [Kluyvera cryocrescens]|uniref:tail fiber domain-containing protein n=1 Tax=Kluyvera cryocrescens TaxID=580 RepID=UPI001E4964D6|nr:tail fiber domain-containing protein [Kluyvera cryocrescens]